MTLGRQLRVGAAVVLACAVAIRPSQAQSGVTLTSIDTGTALFNVGGVQVIHRRLPTSNIVVAQIYLLGGSRQLSNDDAGIERAMLEASAHGTKKYPGGAAAIALAHTGSSIGVHVSRDWSLVELRTVRSELDSAWNVFADRVVAPELSTGAVSAVRDRMYIEQQMAANDPDALIMRFADSVAFAGHPYAIDPNGNERSIRVMRSSEIAEYHKGEVVTSRMLVVFVGHVTRPEIERLVSSTLATLPRGSYTWILPPPLPSQASRVIMIPRALKTNYLLGVFPGPAIGSRDNAAFRVATALLGARIAYTVREEKQLSYAAYAPFFDRAVASGGVYVSTAHPAKVLTEVVPIMSEVLSDGMEWRYLPRFISQFSLDYLLKQETYDGQADELARAHLLRGNLQTDAWFLELKKVSPISMKLMSRKYFPHIQWIYVGDVNAIRSVLKN